MKLKEKFLCLDCETTGLDVEKDRVIEIAAVIFDKNEIFDKFEVLIDPQMVISEESIAIHNITQNMLKGKPTIDSVLPSLMKFINNYVIVGHGINFDISILINEANRVEIDCSILKNCKYIDTLRLARIYGESSSNSLGGLCEHFGIVLDNAHRAMEDVLGNIEVFKMLVRRFKTLNDVFRALDKPIPMKRMPLGKYKDRLFSEIPLDYLFWTQKLNFDKDLTFSIKQEIKKRQKGNSFLQSGNPFQSL